MKKIHNRHIMYRKYLDGKISEIEYKIYLHEQEEREKEISKKFDKFVNKICRKSLHKKCDNEYNDNRC